MKMGEINMGRPLAMKLAFILFTLLLCAGCGGTKSTQTPPPTVLITPASATVQTAATQQFTTTSTGVTWSVNGSVGGNSTTGLISLSGLYTAPSSVPTNPVVTITGQTSSASGTATVTISTGSQGEGLAGSWTITITGPDEPPVVLTTTLVEVSAVNSNGSQLCDNENLLAPIAFVTWSSTCFAAANDGELSQGSLTGTGFLYPYQAIMIGTNDNGSGQSTIGLVFTDSGNIPEGGNAPYRTFLGGPIPGMPPTLTGTMNGSATTGTSFSGTGTWSCDVATGDCPADGDPSPVVTFSGTHN